MNAQGRKQKPDNKLPEISDGFQNMMDGLIDGMR